MTTTKAAAAPQYIAPDTYTGRWMRDGIPADRGASTFQARELAQFATEGIIWESAGHTNSGRELFCRTRYVADTSGALHCYDSSGRKVIVHPADRAIRVLVKR